ncbi:MAG: hypothetical protein AAFS10_18150, partial [Myxococcota bacterium]
MLARQAHHIKRLTANPNAIHGLIREGFKPLRSWRSRDLEATIAEATTCVHHISRCRRFLDQRSPHTPAPTAAEHLAGDAPLRALTLNNASTWAPGPHLRHLWSDKATTLARAYLTPTAAWTWVDSDLALWTRALVLRWAPERVRTALLGPCQPLVERLTALPCPDISVWALALDDGLALLELWAALPYRILEQLGPVVWQARRLWGVEAGRALAENVARPWVARSRQLRNREARLTAFVDAVVRAEAYTPPRSAAEERLHRTVRQLPRLRERAALTLARQLLAWMDDEEGPSHASRHLAQDASRTWNRGLEAVARAMCARWRVLRHDAEADILDGPSLEWLRAATATALTWPGLTFTPLLPRRKATVDQLTALLKMFDHAQDAVELWPMLAQASPEALD